MGWQDWEFPSETKRREEHDEWLRQRMTPPASGLPADSVLPTPSAPSGVVNFQENTPVSLKNSCEHDIANPVQRGRATWFCRNCGADISLHYLFYMDAVLRSEAQCG